MGCWETAVWCQTAKGLDGEEEAWVKVKVGWNPHESSHKETAGCIYTLQRCKA